MLFAFIYDQQVKAFDLGKLMCLRKIEPPHDKINKVACAPSEDSDQYALNE